MAAWLFMLFLLHPLSVVIGFYQGDWWFCSTIILSLGFYPLLEQLWPNMAMTNARAWRVNAGVAQGIMYIATVTIVGLVIWSLSVIADTHLQTWQWVLMMYSVGITAGSIGITLAHELMHKTRLFERGLSILLLLLVCYPHFRWMHVRSHHRYAASHQDTATAKVYQTVYQFCWQSILGGWLENWQAEVRQCRLRDVFPYHPWHNQMIFLLCLQLLLCSAVFLCFGLESLLFFLLQSLVAILVLESINYIQHYGLTRQPHGNSLEKFSLYHAWDSTAVSNFALFNLGLHAEHHVHAGKAYYQLSASHALHRLPSGYFSMAFLALIPPLWFKLMHKHMGLDLHAQEGLIQTQTE